MLITSLFVQIVLFLSTKKSRSLRSQDSAPGKKILTCFGALPARTHSSGGGQSTAVRPEFCPVCVHSPTTEVCMKQVFPNQRHRGALLSLNFPPSWWIGWLHYIPIYPDCQWVCGRNFKFFCGGAERHFWLTVCPSCCILNLFFCLMKEGSRDVHRAKSSARAGKAGRH